MPNDPIPSTAYLHLKSSKEAHDPTLCGRHDSGTITFAHAHSREYVERLKLEVKSEPHPICPSCLDAFDRANPKTGHTCVINDAGNCYTCGERAPYFRVIEPPAGHNPALAGPAASRQAKAQILPPPVPEGETVDNEADVIRVWSLPDAHCDDCHHPQGPMSSVAVGHRIISVCCTVTENFKYTVVILS